MDPLQMAPHHIDTGSDVWLSTNKRFELIQLTEKKILSKFTLTRRACPIRNGSARPTCIWAIWNEL